MKHPLLYALLLLVGIFPLTSCDDKPQDPHAAGGGQMPPPTVTVAQPVVKNVKEWDEFTGRFEAVDKVEVRARVSGYLQSVDFKEGSLVKKGDLLFVIDPRPYMATLRSAQASLQAAEAGLEFAKLEYTRYENLRKTGTVSEKLFQEKTQALRDAEASIGGARSAVEQANLNVGFTRITSPISGRISSRAVSEGNLVQGGEMNATLLTTIVSLDPIHFVFDVDEQTYMKYARMAVNGSRPSSRDVANPVFVALADEKDFTHEGRMDFVDNEIDQTTGTMRGRAVFDNKDHFLTPGQFGRARLTGSGEFRAVMVPDEAMATDQGRKLVMLINDKNEVTPRPVTVGRVIDGLRVIREGLTGDEWVIVNGLQRAQPGMVVTPEKTSLATNTVAISPAAAGDDAAGDVQILSGTTTTSQSVEPTTTGAPAAEQTLAPAAPAPTPPAEAPKPEAPQATGPAGVSVTPSPETTAPAKPEPVIEFPQKMDMPEPKTGPPASGELEPVIPSAESSSAPPAATATPAPAKE